MAKEMSMTEYKSRLAEWLSLAKGLTLDDFDRLATGDQLTILIEWDECNIKK